MYMHLLSYKRLKPMSFKPNTPLQQCSAEKYPFCITLSTFCRISRTERVFHILLTISETDR